MVGAGGVARERRGREYDEGPTAGLCSHAPHIRTHALCPLQPDPHTYRSLSRSSTRPSLAVGKSVPTTSEWEGLKAELTAAVCEGVKAALGGDGASSVVSPSGKAYERIIDPRVDDWLRDLCGLYVRPGSRRRVPKDDVASGGFDWDARFSVSLVRGWAAPSFVEDFYVYGGGSYMPPPAIQPRALSPAKPMAGTEYIAVVEYTRRPDWTHPWTDHKGVEHKALVQRLEERLAVCVRRAIDAGLRKNAQVDDVVALVGIVGEDDCQASFEDLMSKCGCPQPLLQVLFKARRVVFFHCAFKQSVTTETIASPRVSRGSSGGGGGGGASGGAGVAGVIT